MLKGTCTTKLNKQQVSHYWPLPYFELSTTQIEAFISYYNATSNYMRSRVVLCLKGKITRISSIYLGLHSCRRRGGGGFHPPTLLI